MGCYLCGASGETNELVDVILEKEIRKVCRNCAFKENLHIIKKSKTPHNLHQEDNPEKNISVKERLHSLTGIRLDNKKEEKSEELKKQEKELEDMINQNVEEVFFKPKEDANLIRNFHWTILRERRKRKITQKQLAKAISEPEIFIKKIEKGEVPRKREKLIKKIENYLGIKITKEEIYNPSKGLSSNNLKNIKKSQKEGQKEVQEDRETTPIEQKDNPNGENKKDSPTPQIDDLNDFDPVTTKTITIKDLKEMKRKFLEKFFNKKEDNPDDLGPSEDDLGSSEENPYPSKEDKEHINESGNKQ